MSLIYSFIHAFIHSVVCFTTGPETLTKRVLLRERSSASYFNLQHSLVPVMSPSSCLHLHPCLTVTIISPSIFSLIMCFRRQFLRNIRPIQSDVILFVVCRIFLFSLTLRNTSSSKFQHNTKLCTKCITSLVYSLNLSPICW